MDTYLFIGSIAIIFITPFILFLKYRDKKIDNKRDDGFKEYCPGERIYPELPEGLKEKWQAIEPSKDRKRENRPCRVKMKNGDTIDCVYILSAQSYINSHGFWPEDRKGANYLSASDLADISESPFRLPPAIATKIYKAGESGMGYSLFSLNFKDGTEETYVTGSGVVDFVDLTAGKNFDDIKGVLPHKRSPVGDNIVVSLEIYWCLFGKGYSKRVTRYLD